MNINYDANGALKCLVGAASVDAADAAALPTCCGFRADPIPNRRMVDYRVRSSGKRLLMIFRVGSACSDLGKGSRPYPNFPCITGEIFTRVPRVRTE